jgi:hypothetical protein
MAGPEVLLKGSVKSPIEQKKLAQATLPGKPSQDFIVTAPCRILQVGKRVGITASDLPGQSGGTYAWSSPSAKIRLVNATGPTLAVEGLALGSGRDSETITVTRTGTDGSTSTKTVLLTVAKLEFSEATTQNYGFDNMDTPLVPSDHHVCVKSAGETFVKVTISGGAIGTDFNFACDHAATCTADPGPGNAVFDLRLIGKSVAQAATKLRAKVRCPDAAEFASINVNVYAEKVVKVMVAKVADSTSAGTGLNYPTADYAGHQALANGKLKQAVVKYNIRNYLTNAVVDVHYDLDANGFFSFDINSNGGPELVALQNKFPPVAGEYAVVIVRKLKSFYYLKNAANIGDTTITVRGGDIFLNTVTIGVGAQSEQVTLTSRVANVGHFATPLTKNHAVGTGVEFPAGGWATTPILIQEGHSSLDVAKWTVLHEVGHKALKLMDIVDQTDFMHFMQSWTDYRLRYSPRLSKYTDPITENQWEKIPRALPSNPEP